MTKKIIRREKGITLVALVITVAIILILTNVIIYNTIDNLRSTKLGNMQADIENLRDKVSNYYSQYGSIPADTSIEYTNVNHINSISSATDTGPFYVIDLAAMENVTLNYGKDYEKIRTGVATTEQEINSLTDLYIINSTSHNVFYVGGIEVDGEMFYTDYSSEDADKVAVELHFDESKTRTINQIQPGQTSTNNENYEDENGDKAIIPAGFKILPGAETIEAGLVVEDKEGNQFVWIPVTSDYVRNKNYADTNISSSVYTDTGYLPEEVQPQTEDTSSKNEEKEKQLIENVGGFYISRYEAGKENEKLVSKKDSTVWNEISQEDAKATAKTFINNDNVKSSLCSGIQWDMIMNFVNEEVDGIGNDYFTVTSPSEQRHRETLEVAGNNEADKVCNIYDLEGNANEYVAERSNTNLYILRGGSITNENNTLRSASERYEDSGEGSLQTSFRFVLYVINE